MTPARQQVFPEGAQLFASLGEAEIWICYAGIVRDPRRDREERAVMLDWPSKTTS
ncbi:MAG: hypothetical protein ACXWQ5_16180 [Ktedonobacterales bacterium]